MVVRQQGWADIRVVMTQVALSSGRNPESVRYIQHDQTQAWEAGQLYS